METKRPLAPSFINDLDRQLLLNRPEIWTTRIHVVLYYGLLFFILLAGLAFLVPDDARRSSDAFMWVGFVSLLSFIGLIIWCIYLLRFNVFKRFGHTGPFNRLLVFLFYFICIGFFVLMPYVKPYVETVRADRAYGDKELIDDINAINTLVAQLEYDSLDHHWRTDTVKLREGVRESVETTTAVTTTYVDTVAADMRTRIIRPQDLKFELERADSTVKLSDTVYLFSYAPNYMFLTPYFSTETAKAGLYSSYDVYKQLVTADHGFRKRDLESRLNAIADKYIVDRDRLHFYRYSELWERIRERHSLDPVHDAMSNILYRKQRWNSDALPVYLRIHLYITLCLSLLLFTFRHSTARSFFFALLTAVVLSVLTSLIMAFSTYGRGNFFGWILFYFVVFLGISLTAIKPAKRNLVTGIALNLFTWLLPFVPLCMVAAYYQNRRYSPPYYEESTQYYEEMERQGLHFQYAEWIGAALLLIAIAAYIHMVYRRWYAAPEQ